MANDIGQQYHDMADDIGQQYHDMADDIGHSEGAPLDSHPKRGGATQGCHLHCQYTCCFLFVSSAACRGACRPFSCCSSSCQAVAPRVGGRPVHSQT
jgi:hypothetical protein